MTDQWVPAPPQPPPAPPPGLPPANSWSPVTPCASADSPSIADGVIITGRPAVVSAQPWQITVNDGASSANFSIDHFDAAGVLIESPIFIDGSSGDVMLTHDPTQALGAATKQYVDDTGLREAPMDNTTYGRDNGAWVPLPASYMPEAPNTATRFGRFNSTWQADAIQTDAPNDGGAYARQSQGWTPAVTGGPYLPLTGGTLTGPLTLQGSNMVALNAPLSGGQSAILGQKATIVRWQMMLGDQTAEGVGNAGSNFALSAFSTTGAMLGTWLSIARADGAAVFNGSGLTIAGGLAVNGLLVLAGPSNLAIYGGTAGQVLSTNGAGVHSWVTRLADAPSDGQFYTRQNAAWAVAPGGMTDAPNDGTAYARKSAAWAHLTHTDITDWTATLAPYALITAVPVASSTPPLPDGVAAVGTSTTYARADHVHPVVYMGDNRIINGDMRIDQRNNGASGTANGYTVDRWLYALPTTAGTRGTWQRATLAGPGLAATGFAYALLFTSSSAYTLAAAEYCVFQQVIEADMIGDFAWGTSGAQPVTLSFWATASIAGTWSGSLRSYGGTRSYPFTFSLSANTWTKIVVNIPGDASGSWVMNGNAASLIVSISMGCGANFVGPANAWASANYLAAPGGNSVVSVNGATFYLTGVKLEIGSAATPFNRQSLAKTLADCQRYYQIGQIATYGWGGASQGAYSASAYVVTPRASPTITVTANNNGNFTLSSWAAGLVPTAVGTVTTAGAYTINLVYTASAEL